MRRIILSRKGFDAKAGGGASPIFSDGRFFSIPIPQDFIIESRDFMNDRVCHYSGLPSTSVYK